MTTLYATLRFWLTETAGWKQAVTAVVSVFVLRVLIQDYIYVPSVPTLARAFAVLAAAVWFALLWRAVRRTVRGLRKMHADVTTATRWLDQRKGLLKALNDVNSAESGRISDERTEP